MLQETESKPAKPSPSRNTDLVTNLQNAIAYHLKYTLGTDVKSATAQEKFTAIVHAVRRYALDAMASTENRNKHEGTKRVYYLSMEFLIGRLLHNNLRNFGIYDECEEAARNLGFEFSDVLEAELDPALGNGGLGRLAACFLDSMATLGIAGYGYGINYEFGLFKQSIVNGYQREQPDHWMANGAPWMIERSKRVVHVPVYGRVEHTTMEGEQSLPMWLDWKTLVGVPHDMPVVGYAGETVNYLRLYSARSSEKFDMDIFNEGDYINAVQQKIQTETVSKVLYPSDSVEAGKELRLVQEYFFVACAIRDITNNYLEEEPDLRKLPEKVAIQLNDTHPALAVVELMRLLLDEHDMSWEDAWTATTNTLAYTNHTLLPEALEKWPVDLLNKVLPRHLELIYEINRRFLAEVEARFPNDENRASALSLIEEGAVKQVRMAYLSIVGSHSVNGVAALHSELVKHQLVPQFHEIFPDRFNNKTNGVTQRRWLMLCNPGLSNLITEAIGPQWISDLDRLRQLENFVDDGAFLDRLAAVKLNNKRKLAEYIFAKTRIAVEPDTLFDVQIKRFHEYKRQLLMALHIIHLYFSITEDGLELKSPRTFVFSGKAAPGYFLAKLVIKLVNNLARTINNDERVNNQLKVVFIPDYKVSVAERIIPAADLSEQISTAGFEASGTGNMKLSINGALTIGTLDGANVEIKEEVGDENIYIFGLTDEEVVQRKAEGYNSYHYYDSDERIRRILNSLRSDVFCPEEPGLFMALYDLLLSSGDYYMHLADFGSYADAQMRVDEDYSNQASWRRTSLLNIARTGKFSSDRTIAEYARDIWGVEVRDEK